MRRLLALALVSLIACLGPFGIAFVHVAAGMAEAADTGNKGARIPRIGVITPGDVDYYEEAFRRGLIEKGFTPGETIEVEKHNASGNLETGPKRAEELVALDLDVIYAAPGILAKHVIDAEKKFGKQTPVVLLTWDPVGEGLVASAAHPGGNITGVAGVHSPGALLTKQVQLVQDLLPHSKRVVCLLDKGWHKEFSAEAKAALRNASAASRINIETIELQTPDQVIRALNALKRHRPDAMIVPSVVLFSTTRTHIIDFAARNRVPTVYGEEIFTYEGGLMSYGASVADMNRRGAWAVAKVLRGADPANTPIDYNTRFRLVINLRAAKAQGITIPALLLEQADEVIR